uniref:Uncharacterized protein n=1 Tax=Panagrellus redivivus TaxID=6233 RepID=A0A7E4VX80_PANRE
MPFPFDFDLLNDPRLNEAAYNLTCHHFLGGPPKPGSNPWDQIDDATMDRKWKELFALSAAERRFFDDNPRLRKIVHSHYGQTAKHSRDDSDPLMDLEDILPPDAMTTISLTDLFPESVPGRNSNGESSNAAPKSHVRDDKFEKRFKYFENMMSQARQNKPKPPNHESNRSRPWMSPFSEPVGSSSKTPIRTPFVFKANADHVELPNGFKPEHFSTPRVRTSPANSPSPLAKKWFDDENPYAFNEAYIKQSEEFRNKLLMSRRSKPNFRIPELNRDALKKNPFAEAIGNSSKTSNGAHFGFKPNTNAVPPKKSNLQADTQVNTPKKPDVPIPTVISQTPFVCIAENPAIYDEEAVKQFQEFSKTLWKQQAEVPVAPKPIPEAPKPNVEVPRTVNAPLKKGWLKQGLSMSKASSASSSVKQGSDPVDPVVLEDEVIEQLETDSNKFHEALQRPKKAKIPPGLVRPSVLGGFMAPTPKEAYIMATAQFGYPCGDYPSFKKYVQNDIEFNAPNDERLYRAREARKLSKYEEMFANRYNDAHFEAEAKIPEPFVLGPIEKVKPPKDRSGNAQFELDCVCDPRGDDSMP